MRDLMLDAELMGDFHCIACLKEKGQNSRIFFPKSTLLFFTSETIGYQMS